MRDVKNNFSTDKYDKFNNVRDIYHYIYNILNLIINKTAAIKIIIAMCIREKGQFFSFSLFLYKTTDTIRARTILMSLLISDWQLTQTKPDTDPELAEVRTLCLLPKYSLYITFWSPWFYFYTFSIYLPLLHLIFFRLSYAHTRTHIYTVPPMELFVNKSQNIHILTCMYIRHDNMIMYCCCCIKKKKKTISKLLQYYFLYGTLLITYSFYY